ncbi:MAG: 4-diphosphocytidyl-2-C-methyl-D-erythritol kinase [Flavobacteriales bacterium]|jgi:4-diphosphocytidyl-2-C-methyl-D-erythritol kinase
MLLFPNAKINLGLHVLNKRPDGFHDIESVICPVSWCDIIDLVPQKKGGIDFKTTGLAIPGELQDNFIVKSYHALHEQYKLPGLSVHLHKNIPIGGGLGGGSSDVAFFVKGVNDLFALNLTVDELKKIVAPYGSDCPFFIENKAQIARGIGTDLQLLDIDLSNKWVMLVAPNIHVSTKEAYQQVIPNNTQLSLSTLINKPMSTWQEYVHNDFEQSVFPKFPQIKLVKQQLLDANAIFASMSGSGATCYGIFNEEPTLKFPENYPVWVGKL